MTLFFVIVTSLISIVAFNKPELMSGFQFNPYKVYHKKQWYRLLSHGFVHADWMHLIINMFVLFSLGPHVETFFDRLFENSKIYFLILYIGAILISSLATLKKHKDDPWYNSVGASGAVSAIIFAGIFLTPLKKLYLYGIIGIPGIICGILYLIYSSYMSRRNRDNINHDAHFVGAVFGFFFPLILDFKLLSSFINQLLNF